MDFLIFSVMRGISSVVNKFSPGESAILDHFIFMEGSFLIIEKDSVSHASRVSCRCRSVRMRLIPTARNEASFDG